MHTPYDTTADRHLPIYCLATNLPSENVSCHHPTPRLLVTASTRSIITVAANPGTRKNLIRDSILRLGRTFPRLQQSSKRSSLSFLSPENLNTFFLPGKSLVTTAHGTGTKKRRRPCIQSHTCPPATGSMEMARLTSVLFPHHAFVPYVPTQVTTSQPKRNL